MSKESHKLKKQKPTYQGKLFISVVVPVFNDPEGIKTTLESLLAQNYPPSLYEIIVVDNNSSDSTNLVVKEFEDRYPTRVKLLVERDIQGPSAARNKGISASRGEIIAFIDADMWADNNWLSYISNVSGSNDADYVGYNIRIHTKKGTLVGLYNKFTGFPTRSYMEGSHFAVTAGLAVSKSLFRKIGLFDLRIFPGEDVEFGDRCWRSGAKQILIEQIMLHHPARESFKSLMKKHFRVGRGQHQLVELYPDRFDRYKRNLKNIKLVIPLISFKTFRKGIRSNRALSRRLTLKEIVFFYLISVCEKIFRNLGYFFEVFNAERNDHFTKEKFAVYNYSLMKYFKQVRRPISIGTIKFWLKKLLFDLELVGLKIRKPYLGTEKWLMLEEAYYGGFVKDVPRNVVSNKDPRSPEQLSQDGMRGGDRMSNIHHGYARTYAKYLNSFVQDQGLIVLAEIGILKGAGLAIWSDLFEKGRILGFDIDLDHIRQNMKFLKERGAFKNGDPELYEFDQFQDNEKLLLDVLHGDKLNICIDDGFHSNETIITTLQSVIPHLAEKFVYFIEDNADVHKVLRVLYPNLKVDSFGQFTVISPLSSSNSSSPTKSLDSEDHNEL